MADVQITDNTAEAKELLEQAAARALEIIGGKGESYAKANVALKGPKGNPMRSDVNAQVRNSITHQVDGDTVLVGSNLDMAAYGELGTGKEYDPPPEWIENTVQQGKNSGLDHWWFYDEEQGKVRMGLPMKGTPFLRPAMTDHTDEYGNVFKTELSNA